MEDTDAPRVKRWSAAQDRAARRLVKGGSDVLYKRLVPYYRQPIMRSVQMTDSGVLMFYSDDRSYKVDLLTSDGTREGVADSAKLGKDVVIQGVQAHRGGRLVALHYSEGGSDEGTVALLDLDSKDVVDRLHGFIGSIFWLPDRSYYYVRNYRTEKAPDGVAPPASRVMRRGVKDEVVFGKGFPTNMFIGISSASDPSAVLVDTSLGWTKSRPYSGKAADPETWSPSYRQTESIVTSIDYVGGRHLLLSFERSHGEVVSVGRGAPRRLVREREWPLQEAVLLGDSLLCHYMVDACSELRFFGLDGRPGKVLRFPVSGSLVGSQDGGALSAAGDRAAMALTSFALPYIVYSVSAGSRKLEQLVSARLSGSYAVRNASAFSRDGTKVHYFLTHRKGVEPKKALLFGYGGFRISLTPTFNPAYIPLMDDGAAFAVANLRGGLEHGEEWHRAGMREQKHRVFEDYLAIMAALRRKRMDVVGFGRSNGGLLMGATMNARPELFAGVLIGYPVLDMMSFSRLLVGRAWVPEYGDPDDLKDRKFLLDYSPYHNLDEKKSYPPVFIYTGLKDDRVHPSHAFKFYARLKELGAEAYLRVEPLSGHIGTTPEARIREEADKLAFVYHALGMDPRRGSRKREG